MIKNSKKHIKMEFPRSPNNPLYDGTLHNIQPLSLQQSVDNRNVYVLTYRDISYGGALCTTILVSDGYGMQKISFNDYARFNEIVSSHNWIDVSINILPEIIPTSPVTSIRDFENLLSPRRNNASRTQAAAYTAPGGTPPPPPQGDPKKPRGRGLESSRESDKTKDNKRNLKDEKFNGSSRYFVVFDQEDLDSLSKQVYMADNVEHNEGDKKQVASFLHLEKKHLPNDLVTILNSVDVTDKIEEGNAFEINKDGITIFFTGYGMENIYLESFKCGSVKEINNMDSELSVRTKNELFSALFEGNLDAELVHRKGGKVRKYNSYYRSFEDEMTLKK